MVPEYIPPNYRHPPPLLWYPLESPRFVTLFAEISSLGLLKRRKVFYATLLSA